MTKTTKHTRLVQLHVRINPALYRRLKVRAAQGRQTLQGLVVLALEVGLTRIESTERVTDWGLHLVEVTKKGGAR